MRDSGAEERRNRRKTTSRNRAPDLRDGGVPGSVRRKSWQWRGRNSLLLWGTLFWLGASIGPALGTGRDSDQGTRRAVSTGRRAHRKGRQALRVQVREGDLHRGLFWSVLPTAPLGDRERGAQLLMDGYVVEDLAAAGRVVHRPRRATPGIPHHRRRLFDTGRPTW